MKKINTIANVSKPNKKRTVANLKRYWKKLTRIAENGNFEVPISWRRENT